MQVNKVKYVGEQDGPSEQELKNVLHAYFCENKIVQKAYLARVAFDNSPLGSVALCVRSDKGNKDEIVKNVGGLFSNLFGAHEHLDILFVNSQQEKELAQACKPFFG